MTKVNTPKRIPETSPEKASGAAGTNWGERAEFYQGHLDRVSRSFAFCIERLEGPLRAHVGLSYLICRILDTVEDAAWTDSSQQENAFQTFETFLEERPGASEVARWRRQFPPGLPEGEASLLDEADEIFRDFHDLPAELQEVLHGPILSMANGMRFFQARAARGEMRLRDLSEVNQYCFFVAGVVGEILTRLLVLEANDEGIDHDLDLETSVRFGLLRQKVNLLKDQMQDEPEGRFLVPSREAVLRSLKEDARSAMDYLASIPVRFDGYRLFCAWSLLLGLASLPWIERSWIERAKIKIPRERTLILLGEIEMIIKDNKTLKEKFETLLEEGVGSLSPVQSGPTPAVESPDERIQVLLELYQGALPRPRVARLMLA